MAEATLIEAAIAAANEAAGRPALLLPPAPMTMAEESEHSARLETAIPAAAAQQWRGPVSMDHEQSHF